MTISPFGPSSLGAAPFGHALPGDATMGGAGTRALLPGWASQAIVAKATRGKEAPGEGAARPPRAVLLKREDQKGDGIRGTLLPSKTQVQSKAEAQVLSSVEDLAFRPERAAPATAAAMDPAKLAEQEHTKRLVVLCISGDPAAWQQLVASQFRRIYGICYRFTGSHTDAEDLTQEVFLKLYRALGSFDPAKGAFQTWITTLTRNLLVDHFRRTRQDRATDSLDVTYGDEDGPTRAEQLADGGRNQHDQVAQLQMRARIQHALRQISPELREAVILRDLQDMDYKEIAAVLRVPEGTVKSRISRGRGELARILSREGLSGSAEGRVS